MAETDRAETEQDTEAAARRRLKAFGVHLLLYFAAMAVIVPLNLMTSRENIWFVLPLVGWGGVLAIHVAYVMGLFNTSREHGP